MKRGLNYPSFGFGGFMPHDFGGASFDKWNSPWFGQFKQFPPSPAEITSAIAAAKQASANVLIAQQQVQAEKENVLAQQRIANEKEAQANIARQKNEAIAAVQRSEAAAAAQAVILAQQRLATAKAAVSQHQRAASSKEAHAASAIQSAAHAASAEIHRTEHEAAKLSHIQRNDNAAAIHHVTATKDSLVAPLISGGNQIPTNAFLTTTNPWNPYHPEVASWPSSVYIPHAHKVNFSPWG